jgi:hypothetical protein
MSTDSSQREKARERIQRLRERIAQIELVCSGTLRRRTKVCGKPNCRCALDEKARHGPYWEWNRREQGRLVQSRVSAAEAKALKAAMRNARLVRRLLALWERESVRVIRAPDDTS